VARRSSQPREFVRLSPLQFSLSVSVVVILLAGAGLTGYYYGLNQAARIVSEKNGDSIDSFHDRAESKPDAGGITFYSALTEPKKNIPPAQAPQHVETTRTPVEEVPAAPQVSTLGGMDQIPGSGSVMLQVASYQDPGKAQKLLQDLSSEGYAGTVVRAELGERGVWFRVRIGPYSGGMEAESVLKKLRDDRELKGYVVKQ